MNGGKILPKRELTNHPPNTNVINPECHDSAGKNISLSCS